MVGKILKEQSGTDNRCRYWDRFPPGFQGLGSRQVWLNPIWPAMNQFYIGTEFNDKQETQY